jgi:hypothetical protein
MVDGISNNQSSIISTMFQGVTRKNPEDMFTQLSKDAGSDVNSITKEQLQSFANKLKSEGKDTKPLDDMLSKFEKISNGNDSITSSDVDAAIKNGTLKTPDKPVSDQNQNISSVDNSNIPTKQQLKNYLTKLEADGFENSGLALDIQNTINGQAVIPTLTISIIEQDIDKLRSIEDPQSVKLLSTPEEESYKGTITDIRA